MRINGKSCSVSGGKNGNTAAADLARQRTLDILNRSIQANIEMRGKGYSRQMVFEGMILWFKRRQANKMISNLLIKRSRGVTAAVPPDYQLMHQNDRYGKDGDYQSDNIIFIHRILFACLRIFSVAFCMENCDPHQRKFCAKSMHI